MDKENSKLFDEFFDKGNNFLSIGKHEEALNWFNKALEINPHGIGALFNKALALSDLKRYEESLFWFDEGLKIDPNNVYGLYRKGLALHLLNRFEEAMSMYNKAIEIHPSHIDSLCGKATILLELEKHYEAIFWYDKALAIDCNYVWALNKKGQTLSELGQFKDAITCIDKALHIRPNDVFSLYLKGNSFLQLGSYQEALIWLQKAEAIEPDNLPVLYIKGIALICLQAYDEALSCFNRALEIAPNDPTFRRIKHTTTKLKEDKQSLRKFLINRINITLDVKDSKSMLTHHTWSWEIINKDTDPLGQIYYNIQGDVPKDFTDLNVKVTDENDIALRINPELNLPYMKEISVRFNPPILHDQKKTIKLEYDWEETERYYFYELHSFCDEFKWIMNVPNELPIKPTVQEFNIEDGKNSTASPICTITPFNNGKRIEWTTKPKINFGYRFEW